MEPLWECGSGFWISFQLHFVQISKGQGRQYYSFRSLQHSFSAKYFKIHKYLKADSLEILRKTPVRSNTSFFFSIWEFIAYLFWQFTYFILPYLTETVFFPKWRGIYWEGEQSGRSPHSWGVPAGVPQGGEVLVGGQTEQRWSQPAVPVAQGRTAKYLQETLYAQPAGNTDTA